MISSLQPSRPQAQQSRPQNPLFQQQTRFVHSDSIKPELVNTPRNQIEAMPPAKTIPQPPTSAPLYNPAVMHPVFFSQNWRKPPFPLPSNAALNPAANGYVFSRSRTGSNTKL